MCKWSFFVCYYIANQAGVRPEILGGTKSDHLLVKSILRNPSLNWTNTLRQNFLIKQNQN